MKRKTVIRKMQTIAVTLALTVLPVKALADIEINETSFPDPIFRQWISEQSYGKDGMLTEDEIKQVGTIFIWQQEIESLEGIKMFTELKSLTCRKGLLRELDVAGMTNLEEIDVSENELKRIDLAGCKAITKLTVANNRLQKLDVSELNLLRTLTCQNNLLSELKLGESNSLSALQSQNNQLEELDVSMYKNLERLYCQGNKIGSINVSGLKQLSILSCNSNRISALNLSGCTSIKTIFVENNQIRGQAMDELITSMRKTDSGIFCVYEEAGDRNAISYDQVNAARAKGWTVKSRLDDGTTQEYDGMDPESVAAVKSDTDAKLYDLGGFRLEGKPRQKGIYVKEGRKIVYRK